MTLETWNTVLQFASAVLLGLTFVVGAGAIWTSYVLNNRLTERVAGVGRDAAVANERAGRIELEAVQQRERAAKAEADLLQLQQRLASRAISADQERTLVAALSGFRGQNLVLRPVGASAEIEAYCRQIQAAFEKAGLVVERRPTQDLSSTGRTGHWMRIGEDRSNLANAIAAAFLDAGLVRDRGFHPEASPTRNELEFWVWPKE